MKRFGFLLGFLLVFCLVLTGCGQNTPTTTGSEGGAADELNYDELPPNFEDVDPVVLTADMELVEQIGGIYLKRGGTIYDLSGSIPTIVDGIDYGNVGIPRETGVGSGVGRIFYGYTYNGAVKTSFGEVPVPVVREGDQIVRYPGLGDSSLGLYRVQFCGYGPCVYRVDEVYDALWMNGSVVAYFDPFSEAKIYNESGEEVFLLDTGLNYGDRCFVSWIDDDGQERQVETEANCARYIAMNTNFGSDPDYFFEEGEWSEDGNYMVYDLSDLPAGMYAVSPFASV